MPSRLSLHRAIEACGWVKVYYATIVDDDYMTGLCRSNDLEELFGFMTGRQLIGIDIPSERDLEDAFGFAGSRSNNFKNPGERAEVVNPQVWID